eukprot:4357645-Prymnesium_polylepis.1
MQDAISAFEHQLTGGAVEGSGNRDKGLQAKVLEAMENGSTVSLVKPVRYVSLGGGSLRGNLHAKLEGTEQDGGTTLNPNPALDRTEVMTVGGRVIGIRGGGAGHGSVICGCPIWDLLCVSAP